MHVNDGLQGVVEVKGAGVVRITVRKVDRKFRELCLLTIVDEFGNDEFEEAVVPLFHGESFGLPTSFPCCALRPKDA